MNFVSPTNAIITLPFETQIPEVGINKGYITIVLDNVTAGENIEVGRLIFVSSLNPEPITVALKTAEMVNS